MKKAYSYISLMLLAGCMTVKPFGAATLVVRPEPEYQTLSSVTPLGPASINHLTIKLFTTSEQELGISKDLSNADLGNSVAFSNLKANTSYRIKAFAYASVGTSQCISTDDANSYTDVVVGTDDRPTITALKVKLIDKLFNGQGSNSISITEGGYSSIASAGIACYDQSVYSISTFAGNGTAAFTGDGGLASAAKINAPAGIAIDAARNIYLADTSNQRVRKISADGIITTIAGNGTYGFSGNGGPATSAQIYSPYAIAVNSTGDVFIAEYANHCVRKISPDGIISLFAGTGIAGNTGDGGPATSAKLDAPYGVATDPAGNVYIADYNDNKVRKVAPNGTISTLAGNGGASYSGDGGPATLAALSHPLRVAADAFGNVFVCDYSNQRIRKIASNGTITTYAGGQGYGFTGDGGPATSAKISNPYGIATDPAGNVYIADYNNQRIRKVFTNGTIMTVAGNGTASFSGDGGLASSATVNNVIGIAVDDLGNVYLADSANNRIRKMY